MVFPFNQKKGNKMKIIQISTTTVTHHAQNNSKSTDHDILITTALTNNGDIWKKRGKEEWEKVDLPEFPS